MTAPIRTAVVCFLRDGDKILLARIEYKPGDQKWTGIGGFVEPGETLEESVVREGLEETYIRFDPKALQKVAELNGSTQMNFFFASTWSGELTIKEPSLKELRWFPTSELPYDAMHEGTRSWLPQALHKNPLSSDQK